ncbi:hypothetical protein GQ53DRAFT_463581 [Thozetella sp. PMI_491]|nr:hypothetical protein GQ53DRAFT_463581 [Thozetella sp. PMI_491]
MLRPCKRAQWGGEGEEGCRGRGSVDSYRTAGSGWDPHFLKTQDSSARPPPPPPFDITTQRAGGGIPAHCLAASFLFPAPTTANNIQSHQNSYPPPSAACGVAGRPRLPSRQVPPCTPGPGAGRGVTCMYCVCVLCPTLAAVRPWDGWQPPTRTGSWGGVNRAQGGGGEKGRKREETLAARSPGFDRVKVCL